MAFWPVAYSGFWWPWCFKDPELIYLLLLRMEIPILWQCLFGVFTRILLSLWGSELMLGALTGGSVWETSQNRNSEWKPQRRLYHLTRPKCRRQPPAAVCMGRLHALWVGLGEGEMCIMCTMPGLHTRQLLASLSIINSALTKHYEKINTFKETITVDSE